MQVSCAAKLSIANLECDRHLIILVQHLVETFSAVGRQLDVMRNSSSKQTGRRQKYRRG